MGVSKVVYGNDTLIDISNDTVSPSNLLSGATAHDSSGTSISGNVIVPSTLNDLTDVDISSVANGNIIRYNNTSSKWENVDGDDYWLSKSGGTIKVDSGNTYLSIEGATSSNYGQLQLKRGGYAARLTAASDLTNNRDISFPNINGNVVVSANYGTSYTATGSGSTLSNYETWKSLFNRVRTGSFSGAIRRSQLLVSSLDGQANIILSCQRYQSGNYSIWGSFRGSGTAMVWYVVGFSTSNNVTVYKHVLTSTGLTVTNLTDEPAAVESSGEITPVTITII